MVAIKVLPAASSSDGFRRQRLQREARAISALQHPNICTLYDVVQQDGIDYLVMELLEGETLASRVEKVRLSPDQVLAYGIEIADALDAAQHRGIIHRDLKPGNIFLTSHGECKVLDFGLAKVSDDSDDAATLSQPDVLTSPRVAIGTVAYMSPEQARGEPLDARTDIFSLGAVLYEMATGKSPFAGRTSALTFKAILDSDPPPPSQANKAIPPKLDEVIGKCLEKDPELRYQAAAELRTDLKRVKRDSDSQKISAPVAASPASHSKRARAIKILVATLAVLVITGGGVFYWWTHRPLASIAFQHYAVKPLTTSGNVRSLDLSRDGRYLAYIAQVGDQYSLWVQQIATFSNVRILGRLPSNIVLDGVGFSPDGNYLYYGHSDNRAGNDSSNYRIPSMGGTPSKVFGGIDYLAFSDDGAKVAILRNNVQVKPWEVYLSIADSNGKNERRILTFTEPEAINGVAWSPDARSIALSVDEAKRVYGQSLEIVSAENGSQLRTFYDIDIYRFTWLPDGSGIILCGSRPQDYADQLWVLEVADGSLRKITSDLNTYRQLALSANGRILATSYKQFSSSIWIAPTDRFSDANQITTGAERMDGFAGLAWLPGDRLLFTGSEEPRQIWQTDMDGNHRQQLTHFKDFLIDTSVTAASVGQEWWILQKELTCLGHCHWRPESSRGFLACATADDSRLVLAQIVRGGRYGLPSSGRFSPSSSFGFCLRLMHSAHRFSG